MASVDGAQENNSRSRRRSAIAAILSESREIWGDADYRRFYLALGLLGIAVSSGWPLMALFLVDEIGASQSSASLFFSTGLLAPALAVVVGKLSDIKGRHLDVAVLCAVWSGVGWLVLSQTHTFAIAIVVGLAFFSAYASVMAQSFAAVAVLMKVRAEERQEYVSNTIRGGFSLGYIIGPVVGAGVVSVINIRVAFALTGVLHIVSLAPLIGMLRAGRHQPVASTEVSTSAPRRERIRPALTGGSRSLIVFGLVTLAVSSGDAMKLAFLPLFVEKKLGEGSWAVSSLFSLSAVIEIVAMPAVGYWASRVGLRKVVVVCLLVGMADYTLLSLSGSLWEVYIVQVMHVAVIAGVVGLGITVAQRIVPREPAYGISVVSGANALSSPIGSALGSVLVGTVGYPNMFGLPAVFCGVGALVMSRLHLQEGVPSVIAPTEAGAGAREIGRKGNA